MYTTTAASITTAFFSNLFTASAFNSDAISRSGGASRASTPSSVALASATRARASRAPATARARSASSRDDADADASSSFVTHPSASASADAANARLGVVVFIVLARASRDVRAREETLDRSKAMASFAMARDMTRDVARATDARR